MDCFREFPYTLKRVKKKPKIKRKNVWANWREDTAEMQRLACFNDLNNGCEPERFIKNADEV